MFTGLRIRNFKRFGDVEIGLGSPVVFGRIAEPRLFGYGLLLTPALRRPFHPTHGNTRVNRQWFGNGPGILPGRSTGRVS